MNVQRFIPWIAAALALGGAVFAAMPASESVGYDLDAFARLPVLEGGRVKPIDTVARNALLVMRGRQSIAQAGGEVGPDEWLLGVLFSPKAAEALPVFDVDDPDVRGLLGQAPSANRYLSFADLTPKLGEIQKQGEAAQRVDAKKRTRFESAIVNLYDRLVLYNRLATTLRLGDTNLNEIISARTQEGAVDRAEELAQVGFFRPLPPRPGDPIDQWKSAGEALAQNPAADPDPRLVTWAQLGAAWSAGDSAAFNRAVAEATAQSASHPEMLSRVAKEAVFNRAEPFYVGMVIYVCALLAIFVSLIWQRELLTRTGYALLLAGAVVHTTGLLARMILQGRPPVTNLYSSAVFVGWGVVILGLIFERVYRRGVGTGVAAAAGFTTLLIAHHLAAEGDTMEMMRAVLDSNFWLGTHVVTVTIGYSGTFLAGAIAVAYALRRQLSAQLLPETTRALGSMVYGVVCFSMFFSFVGTVLGGIWADQSWGRFWGWDPKENGALLIVLWNAIILHARLGGFARERGLMGLAIMGNVVTSLSWFGVNMLGIGLHSYGFMTGTFWSLAIFVASQLVLATFCWLPEGKLRSFFTGAPATPAVQPASGP
ncbi:MAG: cytochrome c biogenesis protein CcsA [Deltaproteobacteria bacterium]|nr:cytochrome c biogenesis protein CcsA [Deltaproteobacteria bacterium]